MILTAHQPSYLPWLGLFHKIALADAFVCFDTVPMSGDRWEKRNRIKQQSGEPLWLTVPVGDHQSVPMKDLRIPPGNWQKKHWRSIRSAYQKAPYWQTYADDLYGFYFRRWDNLTDLNAAMLSWFKAVLGIVQPEPVRLSRLGCHGEKSELVLDMCRKMGADTYIFGEQGRDYADVEAFEAAGIRVVFQDYQHPTYPQNNGPFVSPVGVGPAVQRRPWCERGHHVWQRNGGVTCLRKKRFGRRFRSWERRWA